MIWLLRGPHCWTLGWIYFILTYLMLVIISSVRDCSHISVLSMPSKIDENKIWTIFWFKVYFFFNIYLFIYVAALGLNCSMWDLVPRAGIKPGPCALEAWSLSHWTIREVPQSLLWIKRCYWGSRKVELGKVKESLYPPLKTLFHLTSFLNVVQTGTSFKYHIHDWNISIFYLL